MNLNRDHHDRNASKNASLRIAQILVDLSPGMQGVVLAELTATYVCQMENEKAREGLLQLHIKSVRMLISRVEEILAGRVK